MSRSLRQHFLGADAAAYQGVKAAYCGWYRGACGRAAEGPSEPAMTPYIRAVLALASDIAGAARIEPEHLLAAMLAATRRRCWRQVPQNLAEGVLRGRYRSFGI